MIEAPPAQEADQSSVPPRLRGGEEEEEDPGEEGRKESPTHTTIEINLTTSEYQQNVLADCWSVLQEVRLS